jgi:hypothetical protein
LPTMPCGHSSRTAEPPSVQDRGHWRAAVRSNDSCPVLRGAVGKVPQGNSLAAYSTARPVREGAVGFPCSQGPAVYLINRALAALLPDCKKVRCCGRVNIPRDSEMIPHTVSRGRAGKTRHSAPSLLLLRRRRPGGPGDGHAQRPTRFGRFLSSFTSAFAVVAA